MLGVRKCYLLGCKLGIKTFKNNHTGSLERTKIQSLLGAVPLGFFWGLQCLPHPQLRCGNTARLSLKYFYWNQQEQGENKKNNMFSEVQMIWNMINGIGRVSKGQFFPQILADISKNFETSLERELFSVSHFKNMIC